MLGLLLLQVLASCLYLGHSEVVNSFDVCRQFFYAGTLPNGALQPSNPARICQRYSNAYHYATLYNREKRIPVYSAYIYHQKTCKRPHQPWLLEPQLINRNYVNEMSTEDSIKKQYKITSDQIAQSQAINQDYKNLKDLDRGHLGPCSHQRDEKQMTATFTLTNIVPQYSKLNKGAWKDYESVTMAQKTQDCKTTYVITGAVPGNNKIGNRVTIPSYIWSAACCVGDTGPKSAWGAIAENDKDKVDVLSLGQLEAKLTEKYGGRVTLFNNACPRE
ncbi:ENDD1 protein, partial [Sylvietta virens]|nr:ENDD1 protein [Sylvietta virens]